MLSGDLLMSAGNAFIGDYSLREQRDMVSARVCSAMAFSSETLDENLPHFVRNRSFAVPNPNRLLPAIRRHHRLDECP